MTLAGLLGQDEHTGADDPYERLLKARKWTVLASVVGWLVGSGAFAPAPFSVLVGRITLTGDVWWHVAAVGLTYAAGIYTIINLQLATSWSQVLNIRLYEKRLARLETIERRIGEIEALKAELQGKLITQGIYSKEARGYQERLFAADQQQVWLGEQLMAFGGSAKLPKLYVFGEFAIDLARISVPYAGIGLAAHALWLSK